MNRLWRALRGLGDGGDQVRGAQPMRAVSQLPPLPPLDQLLTHAPKHDPTYHAAINRLTVVQTRAEWLERLSRRQVQAEADSLWREQGDH